MKVDITIVKEDGNLYCIFLFESSQEMQPIKSHFDSGQHFSMQVVFNNQKQTIFLIKFLNVEYDFELVFNRSVDDYPPLGWVEENLPTYIRLGVFQNSGAYKYIPLDYPVSKIVLN